MKLRTLVRLAAALALTACSGSSKDFPDTPDAGSTSPPPTLPKSDGGKTTPRDAATPADTAAPSSGGTDAAGGTVADAAAPPAVIPVGPAGPAARGVTVGLVEVTQGVFIKVGDGNAVIAPAMRNSVLVEGRPIFTRVHIATDAGFMARPLRSVLTVSYGDGSNFQVEDAKMISGASNVEKLETTFNLLVPADKVKPGSSIAAAIYEMGAAAGPEPAMAPRFPAMGVADLGVKAGKMELDIVFVPDGPLMDTPERRKKLEQDVYDLYPVQKVNFRFHAPVPLMGAFSSAKGFAILRDARTMDNGKPWEYYHYLTAATGVGFTGVSRGAGATVAAAASRVSITIVKGNAIDGNTNTVAHETGHANGVSHMPGCNAAGPDNNYPYTMVPGDVGVNGYSLSFSAFKSRMMFRELMSYCRPRWVSDYVWNKFETRVRIVTGFESSPTAMTQMLANRSLQGFAGPGESANWGIVRGRLVDEAATITDDRYALFTLADGRQVKMPVAVNLATDDVTRELAINLDGADFSPDEVMHAEVVIDGQHSMVPVGSMYRP